MYGPFVYAGDLAKDLGFGGMTPAFWNWCKAQGIEGESGQPFRFDRDKVDEVLWREKIEGRTLHQVGSGAAGNG